MALRLFLGLCFAACATLTAFGARAADPYPAKPVRIVVPFGPGGVADFTIRVVAGKLSERMGRQFIVENKPGAGGIAAAQAVTQSKPDGYTLFLLSNGTAVSASLFKSLPFDPVKDFAAVSTLAYFSLGIVVNGEGRIGTLADLLAAGKAGSTLNAGTINIGSTQHLAAELLKTSAGVDFQVIPFNGSPAVLTALRGRQVDAAVEILGPMMGQIAAKAVRPLAVMGA
jgi:tripartite-type tricarboxylate transporter receptor subunit TctC